MFFWCSGSATNQFIHVDLNGDAKVEHFTHWKTRLREKAKEEVRAEKGIASAKKKSRHTGIMISDFTEVGEEMDLQFYEIQSLLSQTIASNNPVH